jgi:hypothetical protein
MLVCRMLLVWLLFAANLFVASVAWGYDAPAQPITAYDGASISAFDYGSASVLTVDAETSRTAEKKGLFEKCSFLFAAETTVESPLLKPGFYAGASIPAQSTAQTFIEAERDAINKIGYDTGCHTCGTTDPGTVSGSFVPDHQPVSALNTANAPQQLYPQCINCSRQQGLVVARALRAAKQ